MTEDIILGQSQISDPEKWENKMMNGQELKDRCTPEFIKWMCELAEGYDQDIDEDGYYGIVNLNDDFYLLENIVRDMADFPLLIHRSIEGWNYNYNKIAFYPDQLVKNWNDGMMNRCRYHHKSYQPQSLTQLECACLHCMLDIFKEER